MRPSGIGGQAVMEGVMMRNGDKYAVAVRKPDKEIAVDVKACGNSREKNPFFKLPIIRGVVSFIDSLSIGMKTLTYSASFYEEEEEKSKLEKGLDKATKGHGAGVLDGIVVFLSVILAVAIFVLTPMLLANLLKSVIKSDTLTALIEGLIRLVIFLLYIWGISHISDIKRMFMYHGAEHKTINCIENGYELTVENVRKQGREHRRCGTSFLLFVMVVSIIFFMVIRVDNMALKFVLRILLIPVIAGISYEFIRFAGRSNSKFALILSRPGMWLQNLTTREPDDDMIEVAIASVDAVFDWKAFLEKGKREGLDSKPVNKSEASNPAKKDNNAGLEGGTNKKGKKNKKTSLSGKPVYESVAINLSAVKKEEEKTKEDKEVKAAAENVTENAEPQAQALLEVDISQLFDIKLPDSPKTEKKKKFYANTQVEPEPNAPVYKPEEDEILKALDMYFEFDGPKTVIEISDDPNVVVTGECHEETDKEAEEKEEV